MPNCKIILPKTSQPFGTVVVWERKKIGKHGILLFLLATSGVCLETHKYTSGQEKEKGRRHTSYNDSVKARDEK